MTTSIPKWDSIPKVQLLHYPIPDRSIKLTNSREVAQLGESVFDPGTFSLREEVVFLFVNRNMEVIGYYPHSTGIRSACLIDPALVFTTALLCNAANIIMIHNHPSGSLKPSEADITITKRLYEAGILLNVGLLDHLIISTRGFYSFQDEGLLN